MTAVIPFYQIPYANVVKILGKMDFKTACRMRRACRMVNEMAHTQKLYFPVGSLEVFLICLYDTYYVPRWLSLEPDCRYGMVDIDNPNQMDCALFDYVLVKCAPVLRGQLRSHRVDLIQYMENVNIKAHKLVVQNGLTDEFDVMKLFRDCKASSFSMKTIYHEDREIGIQRPLPFDFIRELATTGCRYIYTSYCDYLPTDYAAILSQFEHVHIERIVQEDIYSLASIIKKWITGDGHLKHFHLPINRECSYLDNDELSELTKWPLKTSDSTGLVFFTSDGCAFLMEHYRQQFCVGYKASWDHIDQLAVHWFDYFIDSRIPFDASGLLQVLVCRDLQIKEYMMDVLNHISTYFE